MSRKSDVHIDSGLSALSVGVRTQGFIADKVMPRIPVEKQSDVYFINGPESLTIEDTTLAPLAETRGTSWNRTNASYHCNPYGLHDWLPDEVADNADGKFDPRVYTMEQVIAKVDLAREKRAATLLTNAGSYANTRTLLGGEQWDTYSSNTSDPRSHIATAIGKVQNSLGIVPNTLTIGWKVALALSNHPQVLAGKSQSNDLNALLTSFDLPPVLFGLNLRIGLAGYNTAAIGQTAVIADVWGDYAAVHYVEENPGLQTQSHCATFEWKGSYPTARTVWSEYDRKKRGTRIEVIESGLDEVILNTGAGYLLIDTLSAAFLA